MKQEIEALSQQNQQLFNQYMHMNMQFLSQKLESLEKAPEQVKKTNLLKDQPSQDVSANRKKTYQQKQLRKKINKCGHEDKQHYAKGLCNNCYHKHGRTKKPWNCPHDKLYAAGMCQNCYINSYNKKKRLSKDSLSENIQLIEHEAKVEESQEIVQNQIGEKDEKSGQK